MAYPSLRYRARRRYPDISYSVPRPSYQIVTDETSAWQAMGYQVEPCQILTAEESGLVRDFPSWFDSTATEFSFAIEPPAERKIDAVLEKLKEGVGRIHDSAVFREFLLTMSKFHNYSVSNQILIMLQKPEATKVAGFMTWKDLGRYVRAGEKGIAILAPCLPPAQELWERGRAQWLIRRVNHDWGIYNTRNEAGMDLRPAVLVSEPFRSFA